jgi:hypothetical protein
MMAGGGAGHAFGARGPPCISASAVREMLSNTAETKPKASVVGHEAAGSFSTGINEAAAPGHPFH